MEGNLNVVSAGLDQFMRATHTKQIDKILVSSEQKIFTNGANVSYKYVPFKSIMKSEREKNGFLGIGKSPLTGSIVVFGESLINQPKLQQLSIGARLAGIDGESLALNLT